MLRSTKDLIGYKVVATDGHLGKVADAYFDDHEWTVRYVVIDTGGWLAGQLVLVSPVAVARADGEERELHVMLTREQVEQSPPASTDGPFSRQMEQKIAEHFNWPFYWSSLSLTGMYPPPPPPPREIFTSAPKDDPVAGVAEAHTNLRSLNEVVGYSIHATDGEVGTLSDLIVAGASWRVRYVVADVHKLTESKRVLLSAGWVSSVTWRDSRIDFDIGRTQVAGSPEFHPSQPVNREVEVHLYDYYGKPHDFDGGSSA
jgi:hypothetical protein